MATLISTTCATTGCYSTWDLTPQAVVKLDGFREGKSVTVKSADNEDVKVTSDTALWFKGVDGAEGAYQFRSIEVQGPLLVGVEREKGAQVNIDLSRMAGVQAKNFSPGKTALATSAVVAGAIPLGLFVFIMTKGFGGGRPLRVPGQASPVRATLMRERRAHATAWRPSDGHEAERARIFAHWAKEASAESASIPAFLALARDLKMASAPASLVQAALRAAREEATHTQLCEALANDHAEMPIAAIAPPTPDNADVDDASLVRRLALEAFWDGCVAEGSAATVARRSALLVADETTRLALQTIARDEEQHAELAKRIVAYCLSTGGRAVRHALVESFERKRAAEEAQLDLPDEVSMDEDVDREFLGRRGVPGNELMRQARIETWEKSAAFLARLQAA